MKTKDAADLRMPLENGPIVVNRLIGAIFQIFMIELVQICTGKNLQQR